MALWRYNMAVSYLCFFSSYNTIFTDRHLLLYILTVFDKQVQLQAHHCSLTCPYRLATSMLPHFLLQPNLEWEGRVEESKRHAHLNFCHSVLLIFRHISVFLQEIFQEEVMLVSFQLHDMFMLGLVCVN